MRFDVLGPIRVTDGTEMPVQPSGRLRLGLLSLLLSKANTPVSAEYLLEALWGAPPDPVSLQRLQTHVHRLRKTLGEPGRLTFDSGGYSFRVEPAELDTDRFDDLVTRATGTAEAASRVDLLRSALGLWRGVPFQGVDLVELTVYAQQLIERRHIAFEELYAAELERGRHAVIVTELTELVRSEPLRERPRALLMTALYRCGRQAEALAVYQDARRTLVDELGLDPGPELREVERRILAGEDFSTDSSVPTTSMPPAQLPPSPRDFVARRPELAMLERISVGEDGSARLVVVTGTAGVGKTALVTHWAHSARDDFPDGQLYVDLQGFSPHDPLPASVALGGFLRALGEDGSTIPGDPAERASWFRTVTARKSVLVVLDNAASAEQVRPLLPGGSSCLVVVTSRDALSGLTVSEGAYRLDVERLSLEEAHELVQAWVPHAGVTQSPMARLIEHCARLPLALRVVAERLRSRSSHDIPSLVADLDCERDRLDVLETGDSRTSIRAVLSWSYQQLAPEAARLFRLCGFRCSHPRHFVDIHNTCALLGVDDVRFARRLLDELVRYRLLEETPDGRYEMHDLLQSYALELAGESESQLGAQSRLFGYYLHGAVSAMASVQSTQWELRSGSLPETGTPELSDGAAALQWLDTQRPNLVCMAELAVEHGWSTCVIDLSAILWPYFELCGHFDESRRVHELARQAARENGQRGAEGIATRSLGALELRLGCSGRAEGLLREALALHADDEPVVRAATMLYFGAVQIALGRADDGVQWKEQALDLCGDAGSASTLAMPLGCFGEFARQSGHYEEASWCLLRARDLAEKRGYLPTQILALLSLAELSRETERYAEALDFSGQATELADEIGVSRLIGSTTVVGEAAIGLRYGTSDQRALPAVVSRYSD